MRFFNFFLLKFSPQIIELLLLLAFSVEEKKERTLNNILSAKNKIRYEISELNDRLKASKESNAKLKAEIAKLEADERGEADVVTWQKSGE